MGYSSPDLCQVTILLSTVPSSQLCSMQRQSLIIFIVQFDCLISDSKCCTRCYPPRLAVDTIFRDILLADLHSMYICVYSYSLMSMW